MGSRQSVLVLKSSNKLENVIGDQLRPAVLFAVIWLGWLISWMVAALWSNRIEKRLFTWDVLVYRILIASGVILVVACDRLARRRKTNLARWIYGRLSPLRSNAGGDLIRLVGADSSRTSLVLGSDPQAKPSRSGHRSVRSRVIRSTPAFWRRLSRLRSLRQQQPRWGVGY